jgi:hypothetical protein
VKTTLQFGLYAAIVSAGCSISHAVFAQTTPVDLLVVDGKTGKPIEASHIVVFAGPEPADPRFHKMHVETFSGKDGSGIFDVDAQQMKWIQIWVDGRSLCQNKPNYQSFEVAHIESKGLSTPNMCSSLAVLAKPGQIVVFARERTLREKMAQ